MTALDGGDGLSGSTGLVTGSASGIGRASAVTLARAGARVIVADIDGDGGQETVELVQAQGGEAEFILCDVGIGQDIRRLVNRIVDRYGALDFAHNNVGIVTGTFSDIDTIDEDAARSVVDVNLMGTWMCLKYELAVMRRQGRGAIVNTASVCGDRVNAGASPYNATKAGVMAMTKEAAVEFARVGVRVNAVCPGYVATPLTARLTTESDRRRIMPTIPLERFARPEEIAEAVRWLLSNAASYVTGHCLAVDGGLAIYIPAPDSTS